MDPLEDQSCSGTVGRIRARLASQADLPRVADLLQAHRREAGVDLTAPLRLALDQDGGQQVILAEMGERPVGMLVAQFLTNVLKGAAFLLLSDIYVLPGHRRGGIAGILMAEVERLARARGCAEMRLLVADINQAALITAARAGFTRHDDLLLARSLTVDSTPARSRSSSGDLTD